MNRQVKSFFGIYRWMVSGLLVASSQLSFGRRSFTPLEVRQSFARLSLFFGQVAVVAFGGVYGCWPIAQAAVETHSWLTPAEILDGLGISETTPVPLTKVVQFVGFPAARNPGWRPCWPRSW